MRDDLDALLVGGLIVIVILITGAAAFTIFHHEPSIPQAPVHRVECPSHMHIVHLELSPFNILCERNK